MNVGVPTPTTVYFSSSSAYPLFRFLPSIHPRHIDNEKDDGVISFSPWMLPRHTDNDDDNGTITSSLSVLSRHVDNEEDGVVSFSPSLLPGIIHLRLQNIFVFNLIADIPDSLSQILTGARDLRIKLILAKIRGAFFAELGLLRSLTVDLCPEKYH